MSNSPSHPDADPDDQSDEGSDPRLVSVEDNWQELLLDHCEDLNQETAEQIIRSLQSHPTLAFGDPSRDQTQELIETSLEELALTEYGISDSESAHLKQLMKRELEEGLAGNRIGPMALTTPAHIQVEPDIEPPGGTAPARAASAEQVNEARAAPGEGQTQQEQEQQAEQREQDELITVDQSELADTDNAAAMDPDAGAGAGAAGAVPDADADADADADSDSGGGASAAADSSDAASPQPQTHEIDQELDVWIANQVVAQMKDEQLSEDPPDELLYLIGRAAELGADNQQQLFKRHLFGHLDENARDLVFESTMLESIKEEIAREIQQMKSQS